MIVKKNCKLIPALAKKYVTCSGALLRRTCPHRERFVILSEAKNPVRFLTKLTGFFVALRISFLAGTEISHNACYLGFLADWKLPCRHGNQPQSLFFEVLG